MMNGQRRGGSPSAGSVVPRCSGPAPLAVGLPGRRQARTGLGYPQTGLVLVDPLGTPIRPEACSDRFRVLSREAGVPVVRLHSVRHTLALIMHRVGVAPVDAASFLGHTVEVHYATYLPRSEREPGALPVRSVWPWQGLSEISVILHPIPQPATRADMASDKAEYVGLAGFEPAARPPDGPDHLRRRAAASAGVRSAVS
jgi:hypothetical protein